MKSQNKLAKALLSSLVALAWSAPCLADDIDIYSVPANASSAPNVMFLLDNTSNWSANAQAWKPSTVYTTCLTTDTAANCQSVVDAVFFPGVASSVKRPWQTGYNGDNTYKLTQGQVEIRVLRRVLAEVACSGNATDLKINVGLSLLSSKSTASNGHSVGVINKAVKPLTGTQSTAGSTCKALADQLTLMDANINSPDWKAPSNANYGAAMYEIFKYFGGYTDPTNARKTPQVAGSPVSGTAYGPKRFSSPNTLDDAAAFVSAGSDTYKSPLDTASECARNYVILVGNTFPNAEPTGPQNFDGLGYVPPSISGGLASNALRKADEWAYFLANTDVHAATGMQPIYTYTLDIFNASQDTNQTKLLQSMAANGGIGPSGYFQVNGDITGMMRSITKILINIAAIDSVFTATSLPVSTTTQGSYLNQLFIGMFRPDENARPRWCGNIKQYKLAFDTARNLIVVDQKSNPAIDYTSGFFAATTSSLWTASSNFFSEKPSGTPLSASDNPDGAVVEKGGAAQRLRTMSETAAQRANRKVFTVSKTTTSQAAATFPKVSTSVVGSDSTGTASVSLSAADVNWVFGENNVTSGDGTEYFSGRDSSGNTLTVRPSIHADVLHSRPVALNYGKDAQGKDNIVVFYGTNDGLLHAIDGRQDSSTAGNEYWSFLAPESYATVQSQRSGSPEILLPVNTATGALNTSTVAQSRKYGMDGPIGVLALYNTSGALTSGMIYAGMRRGGGALYAFDVSGTPAGTTPTLSWVIRPTTTGFGRLGQTWSTPRVLILNPTQYTSQNAVVIFGAGYNTQEDDPSVTPSGNIGKAVYVVNALTGARLLEITGTGADAITASVVGDVSFVDADLDGRIDRLYFADVQGGVYRVDIGATYAGWTIKKIANLGRKIFHAPDVTVTKDFVAVFVGTGDREKPLLTSTAEGFYMIKDSLPSQANLPIVVQPANLKKIAAVDTSGNLQAVTSAVSDTYGCYMSLATNGEKVVNNPLTIAGVTYFGTNKPMPAAANACVGSLGEARSYRFPVFCQMPSSTRLNNGGYPPSPVGGLVTVDGELVPFVIGGGAGNSAFEAERPKPTIEPARSRTFWRVVPKSSGNM